MEVINYYNEKDPAKAAQIAELGFMKCKDSQTADYITVVTVSRITKLHGFFLKINM